MNKKESLVKPIKRTVIELLLPSVDKFGSHPFYDKVKDKSKDLAARLMLFKYGEVKDIQEEHNLLMEVSSHLLALDGEEVEAERLVEVAERAADFGISFFDIERNYPLQVGEVRDRTMEIVSSVQKCSKEAVINQLLYAFVHISQRTMALPVERAN